MLVKVNKIKSLKCLFWKFKVPVFIPVDLILPSAPSSQVTQDIQAIPRYLLLPFLPWVLESRAYLADQLKQSVLFYPVKRKQYTNCMILKRFIGKVSSKKRVGPFHTNVFISQHYLFS